LAAQFAFGANFTRHAGYFRGENAQLLNHGVDDIREAKEFTLQWSSIHIQLHRLREISLRDGSDSRASLRLSGAANRRSGC